MRINLIFVALFVVVVLATVSSAIESAVQEVVRLRNDHTRVWEYTRQVPAVDPHDEGLAQSGDETGKPEFVTVRNQVYEKADNLCYNRSTTKIADWVPTVEEIKAVSEPGVAYQANQGVYQVNFTGDLTTPWSVIYKTQNQPLRLGVRYLGYYDASNGNTVFLASVSSATAVLRRPNKLYYANVFPGVDVEYVYTRSAFQQNAIIHSLGCYSTPSQYGFNPASTYLIIATELDLPETSTVKLTINSQRYSGDRLIAPAGIPISVSNASTGKWLCSFEPNYAYDNSENRKEQTVHQQLTEINGKHYLVEGIPLTWLTTAALPVTIDYELRTGGLSGNEVWRSGNTYYISTAGNFTVNDGYTLVIEGGAIVKLASNRKIQADAGAQIDVMGSKFNYVLFTSANDTCVGEPLDGNGNPQVGDYSAALVYNAGAKNNSRVNYAKIRYGDYGIRYYSNGLTVTDSIIRNCTTAIYCSNTSTTYVTNNIISQCTKGVCADNSSWIRVNQNTIDSTYYGVSAGNSSQLVYYDNIFSNITAVSYSWNTGSFPEAHHNAFWNYVTTPTDTEYSVFLSYSPYTINPNGQYQLDPKYMMRIGDEPEPTNECLNKGSMSAEAAGMNLKTVFPPLVMSTTLDGYTNEWKTISRDSGIVDIGFHFDPVDIVIAPENNYSFDVNTSYVPLSINPGVVVAFYRTVSNNTIQLRMKTGGKLTAVGNADDFIRFTSVYATSDEMQLPLRGGLDLYDYYGLLLRYDADLDSNIQFSECNYAQYGIRVNGNLNLTRPIQNNVFQKNYQGITFNYCGNAVNNLFIDNNYGIVVGTSGAVTTLVSYIQSNTFYNNDTAVYITNTLSSTTGRRIITRLENNIFNSNYAAAISTTSTNSYIHVETRNNLFWNNEINAAGSSLSLNTSTTENKDIINSYSPMLVHKARVSADQKVTKYLHDGFYLAQRTGDASRFPIQNDNLNCQNPDGIEISGLTYGLPYGADIKVYASDGCSLDNATLLGWYLSIDPPEDPDHGYHDGGVGWGNLLLDLTGITQIASGDYITLHFANGNSINVYLPETTVQYSENRLLLWIAQDGSSYYARGSRAESLIGADQDACFAMQYDIPNITGREDTGLAKSAYDGGARSPAIDKGAVKITPASFAGTNSDVTCSNFASLGFTNSEDTVDNNRDSSTTLRWIAETTAANYIDPVGRLDLGYHYRKGVVYTTDIVSTFRFNGKTYVYDTAGDYLYQQSEIFRKAVAGKFDTTTLNGTNLVVFPASGLRTTAQYIALGYHIQGTPVVKGIAEYSMPTTYDTWPDAILSPKMWINFSDVAVTPDGATTFAVIQLTKNPYSGDSYFESLYVYQFDNTLSQWTTAVAINWEYDYANHSGEERLGGLAIAADTGFLWLAISVLDRQKGASDLELGIKVIALPYSDLPVEDLTLSDIRWKTIRSNIAPQLDMTYDITYSNLNNINRPTMRLIYHNYGISAGDGLVHASRIELLGIHGPTVTSDTVVSLSGPEGQRYRIVYNPHDITGGKKQAFATLVYNQWPARTGHGFDLDARNPAEEFWGNENSFDGGHSFTHDLTYRVTGDKFIVWTGAHVGQYDDFVSSNSGKIEPGLADACEPSVFTNPVNKQDIVASWHSWYDYLNDGGKGDDEVVDEGVAVCRELYP